MNLSRRTVVVGVAMLVAAIAAAACSPSPGTPTTTLTTTPTAPVVNSFQMLAPRRVAPVTATFQWRISDANGDSMTCRFDFDGDGTVDQTVTHCPTSGDLLRQYTHAGQIAPTLTVTDGTLFSDTATVDPVVVTAGPSEPFNITLLFDPGIDPTYRAAFEAAAHRWEQVIVDGWAPEPLSVPQDFLGWIPAFNGTVDDVLIAARAVPLDGPLGLLGQAGTLASRAGDGTPYFGMMEFDSADLADYAADGRLLDLILHEMGHVLGIGTTWVADGRIDDALTNPTYNGAAGNAAWHELGGAGKVPVEDQGGPGTRLVHWRETTFDTELMTGYSDGGEQLSRVTVGALADRGYGVDLSAADEYHLPGTWPLVALRAEPRGHQHTTLVQPLPESVLATLRP